MTQITLAKCKVDQLVKLCEEFGNQPGELINILHKAQGLIGYLPREVQEVIARQLDIPVSKVYGVVTFYSFFSMTPKGEHPISVCMGTACYVRGAEKVLDEFKRRRDYPRREVLSNQLAMCGRLRTCPGCTDR